jgi:hypothetical protein
MVEAGKLDMSLGIFKAMADVRREPFFRFSLMVARASKDEDIPPRRTTTWSALDGETLISLSSGHPHQQLIDKHLAQAGVKVQIGSIVNLLHADCPGRSRRRYRHHSVVWDASVPQPKGGDEPTDQSRGALRLSPYQ